ncbi:MAG: DNA primase [Fimbriimonadaceae bacterium]|nr:DNA primase [Fimbriimonadaceae bacterium]
MADDLSEIRSRVDLVDLVGRQVALKRAGKHWKGLCPFHEDSNPSFSVSQDVQRYRCWACGESGDVFTWVMKTQRVEFPEALRILADLAGVKLTHKREKREDLSDHRTIMRAAQEFFRQQLDIGAEAKSYCQNRGLDAETLVKWEIGYAPDAGDALGGFLKRKGIKLGEARDLFLVEQDSSGGYYDRFRGRLMFPIRDDRGELVAFGGRIIGDGIPKYINSSDTPLYRKSRVLYGFHQARDAIAKSGEAVLVEGYLDAIACHRADVANAVASLGTALSEEHAKLLKRWCKRVTVLYDADAAGEKAALRATEILGEVGLDVRVALMAEGEDPDTLLRGKGAAAVARAVAQGVFPIEFRLRSIDQKHTAAEPEYWTEVVDALSAIGNAMELDRYLVAMAKRYPGSVDQLSAQRALKSEVVRRRRQARMAPGPLDGPVVRPRVAAPAKYAPEEKAVFRALFDPALRPAAWRALGEDGLVYTPAAVAVQRELSQAFAQDAPIGSAGDWLAQVSDPDVAGQLADLSFEEDPTLSESWLADCLQRLRDARDRRERLRLAEAGLDQAEDAQLAALQARLRGRRDVRQADVRPTRDGSESDA